MREIKYQTETLNTDIACKPLNSVHFGGGARCKALLAAVLLGTMPAVANELDVPTLGDESAYTLTKVDAEGENTITKFEYNSETGEFTPVYYRVNLRQTAYGEQSGDKTLKFGWEYTDDGRFTFVENPSAPVGSEITYTYDSSVPTNSRMEVSTDISDTPITGNFIGNYEHSGSALGGAIYNKGTISDITGDFIGNYAGMQGGAIYNKGGTIGDITGDFIGNYAGGAGGAIASNSYQTYNDLSPIGNITGDFIGNYAGMQGGAIFNEGSVMGDINGDFIGNYANGYGGAIANSGLHAYDHWVVGTITYLSIIRDIKGDFIGNHVSSLDQDTVEENYLSVAGGAIANFASYDRSPANKLIAQINNLTGDFIGNYVKSETLSAQGGAIANFVLKESTASFIGNIKGNFTGNYAQSESGIAQGGAIYNSQLINSIQGEFHNNYASGHTSAAGGAIYNTTDYSMPDSLICMQATYVITDDAGNPVEEKVLYYFTNEGGGEPIQVNFAIAAIKGGATVETVTVNESITQEEYDQLSAQLEAMIASGLFTETPPDLESNTITPISNSMFVGNKAVSSGEAYGGAIASVAPEDVSGISGFEYEIVNSSFYDNVAETTSETGTAKGGAIYSMTDLTITADNGESVFSGNKVINNGVEESNAIYMDAVGDTVSTLTLQAKNNGVVYFDDKIDGAAVELVTENETRTDRYNIELKGDGTGKIVFNNDVENADIFLNNGAITYLGRESVWDTSNLTFNGGSLSLLNNTVGTANFDSLSIAADTDVTVDVDLANSAMDRITADSYGEMNGNLNVVGMNLLSDSAEEQTEILFADAELKDHVTYGGNAEIPDDFQTTAYTPIYKYNVSYDNKDDGGYFLFNRGDMISGGGGNQSDNFNPAVLSAPVSTQAANQSALNEVFKYTYEHLDTFTKLPEFERDAIIESNKYAMSTDFNNNMSSGIDYVNNKGVWFKPFTTFENIDLKNGPKVDAITYGTLVGFDTDFKELGKGWNSVFSGFAGYVGSSLNYSGVDSTMNGGILGFTETFYKGNFWTAISATAGASVGESHNMYGKEDYTSLLAGVSSKTGYNFEFKNGKFIVQPIMYLGYTFVNTFDYKNSAGVNIDSDPLHTIQLNPSVRFIANLKNGWQPYASVGMVWNLMNESKATANNVRLPEMSVKPYVEYGVGVQRNWADKYTGYLQAMVRNGGRTGVSLTGGFRFMLGDETKVTPETPKKDIKSL